MDSSEKHLLLGIIYVTLMPNTYDPSRGLTYFNAMIGQANYFNNKPADPEKQLIGGGFREIFCGVHTRSIWAGSAPAGISQPLA